MQPTLSPRAFSLSIIAIPALLLVAKSWPAGGQLPGNPAPAEQATIKISGVFVDVSRIHHDAQSNGDTWDYAWAADGTIYTFNCDGRGYGSGKARNLSFNHLTGYEWDKLAGTNVNPMDYGAAGAAAPNGSNWKTTGADSIDGVIYAFLANNWYGSQNAYGGDEPDPNIRQTVANMSLIKSADNGKTWVRDAQTNYEHPMWTSRKFSTAFFVKYGQDGGKTTQDGQDKYVYAISNDGYWNCGSHFYLGRVPRSRIARLNAPDWEFYSNGNWSNQVEEASPLAGFSNGQMKETMGSPLWLPTVHKYVTVTWFDPGTTEKWHFPENVTFAFYEADRPWGPWSWIGEKSAGDFIADRKTRIHRWYGPSLSPRFVTDNPDGSVTAILLFSGQTWEDTPESLYKNNSLPVTFYTKPQPKEVRIVNDTSGEYSQGWTYQAKRGLGDYSDDVHVSKVPNASVEFVFEGRGVELLSEKSSRMGRIEVFLDGESKGTVSLYQDPMPLLYQVEVYRNVNLPDGRHTLKVVNRSQNGEPVLIDGLRVYGANDFDSRASYMIVNRATRHALRIDENSLAAEALRDADADSHWEIEPFPDCYRIFSRKDGGTIGDDPVDGSAAVLKASTKPNEPASAWNISPVGNGSFSITNKANGLALTEELAGAPRFYVSQRVYLGRDLQKWEILNVR